MDDKPKKRRCGEAEEKDIPIRDFPDLRRLRKAYLNRDGKPVGVDSNDTPLHDCEEGDFGLTRSTPEEAWEFLRQMLEESHDDDLTEFLDDDD